MLAVAYSIALPIYSLTVSLLGPARLRFLGNVALALVVIRVSLTSGLSRDDLGLSRRGWAPGLRVGAIVSVSLAGVLVGASLLDGDRAAELAAEGDIPNEIPQLAYEVLVRIPIETAAVEEVLFRGAVFAAWRRSFGTRVAFLGSSLAYALWHIGPSLADTDAAFGFGVLRTKALVPVLTTFVLGLIYAALRLLTKGVVGPTLIHAVQNGSLLAAGFIALR